MKPAPPCQSDEIRPTVLTPLLLSLFLAWAESAYQSAVRGHYLLQSVAARAELLGIALCGAVVFVLFALVVAGASSLSVRPHARRWLGATLWIWLLAAFGDRVARNVITSPFRIESVLWLGAVLLGATGAAWVLSRCLERPLATFFRTRWGVLTIVALGFVCAFGGKAPPRSPEPDTRPDVILVSIDTARADLLSAREPAPGSNSSRTGKSDDSSTRAATSAALGAQAQAASRTTPPMPELDRLAEEGIVFERAVAQENWTLPSHASILTSLYPAVHGVEDLDSRLADSTRTLAESFAAAGYRTLALVDGDPSGFIGARRGFDHGFDDYVHFPDARGLGEASLPGRVWSDLLIFTDRGHAEDLVGSALRWLEIDDPRPAFLFLHIYDVHSSWGASAPLSRWPYMARSEYFEALDEPIPPRDRFILHGQSGSRYLASINEQLEQGVPAPELLLDSDRELLHNLYRSSARYVDNQLARLWDRLRAEESRPALTVVTSDHGEEFLEHGRLGHDQEYDECIRVPLVLAGVGTESQGRRVPEVVELIDIAPTLLELTGVPVPSSFQGRSLLRELGGTTEDRTAYWGSEVDQIFGLRSRSFAYFVKRRSSTEELYDLREDPLERRNLADLPEAASLLDSLRTEMALWRRTNLNRREGGARITLDEETREKLRSLGYIR